MVYHKHRIFGNPTKTGTESIENWAKKNGGVITRPRHTPVPPSEYANAVRWQTCRPPMDRFISMYRFLQRHDNQWGKGYICGNSFQVFLDYWSARRNEFLDRVRRFNGRKPLSSMQGWDWLCTQSEFRAEFKPNFIVPLSLLPTILPGIEHRNVSPKVELGSYTIPSPVNVALREDAWARARKINRL